jgi:hypothetical protein
MSLFCFAMGMAQFSQLLSWLLFYSAAWGTTLPSLVGLTDHFIWPIRLRAFVDRDLIG